MKEVGRMIGFHNDCYSKKQSVKGVCEDRILIHVLKNCLLWISLVVIIMSQNQDTAQKIKFSIKDFFSKYDQIHRKLRCSHIY